METTTDRSALEGKLIPELQRIAQEMGIEGTQKLRKAGLIDAIVAKGGNGGQESAGNGEAQTPAATTGSEPEASTSAVPVETEEAPSSERSTGTDEERGDRGDDRRDRNDGREQGRDRAPERNRGQDQNRDQNRGQDRDQNQNRGQDRNRDQDQNRDGGRDRDGRRQRPSREERRRQREERRVREEQERAEEIANAPTVSGILDLLPDGYGFLRTSGYTPGPEDVYVSLSQVRKMSLRKGDVLEGKVRRPRDNEKYAALLEVDSVNGMDPEAAIQAYYRLLNCGSGSRTGRSRSRSGSST